MPRKEKPKKTQGSEKELLENIERYYDKAVDAIPYKRFAFWKALFFHPTATLEKEKSKPNLTRAGLDLLIATILNLLPTAVIFAIIFLVMLLPSLLMPFVAVPMVLILLVVLVLIPIGTIAGWLFYSAILHLVANLLGGKGEFTQQAYLTGVSFASVRICGIPVFWLSAIPCVNILMMPFSMVLSFYPLYLQYLIVKSVYKLSPNRSVIAVILPIFLIYCAFFALFILLYFGLIFSVLFLPLLFKIAATGLTGYIVH